jgi:hypothetical protein
VYTLYKKNLASVYKALEEFGEASVYKVLENLGRRLCIKY